MHYSTIGFDANSLEEMKNKYIEYYDNEISNKDVGYIICYSDDDGIELDSKVKEAFIEDVNEGILEKYFRNRTESQKWNDYQADLADYNWKERI